MLSIRCLQNVNMEVTHSAFNTISQVSNLHLVQSFKPLRRLSDSHVFFLIQPGLSLTESLFHSVVILSKQLTFSGVQLLLLSHRAHKAVTQSVL